MAGLAASLGTLPQPPAHLAVFLPLTKVSGQTPECLCRAQLRF